MQPKLTDSVNLLLETSMNNIRFFEQSIRKIENVINRDMTKLAPEVWAELLGDQAM